MRRRWRASALALASMLTFPVGTAVGQQDTDGAGGWRVAAQQLTGEDSSVWNQVSARSASDIWVAGLTSYDIEQSAGVPVVSHWDGKEWRTHVFEEMHEVSDVNGLSAVGPDDVWLSLREYGAKSYLHFDGTEWTSVTTDGSGKWSSPVSALPGEAWTIANARVVAHYDGTEWSHTSIAKHGRLASISAAAPDDVWAVGNAVDTPKGRLASDFQPLAKHWDGQEWRKTPVPSEDCSLTDVVAVARDSAWAQCVGRDKHGGAKSFRVLRWDGVEWTETFGPVLSTSLGTFAANADGQVWLGGTEELWHFDGERWTIGSLPGPQAAGVTFGGRDTYALAALPGTDQAVAVGTAYVDSVDSGQHPRRDLVWRSSSGGSG